MNSTSPVIVTEIPHSGASVVAHILRVCGAWCAPAGDWPARLDDEGGNKRLRDTLIRPLFRGLNANSLAIGASPDLDMCRQIAPTIAGAWRNQALRVMREQGYERGPWVYRGSDALLIWPIWVAAFPRARWVVAQRDDAGILRSCAREGRERRDGTPLDWEGSIKRHRACLQAMVESGIEYYGAWPGRFMHGKIGDIEALIGSLGLAWNREIVQSALTPILWSNGIYEFEGMA